MDNTVWSDRVEFEIEYAGDEAGPDEVRLNISDPGLRSAAGVLVPPFEFYGPTV
ncbi:MAG: hypothetical protein ABFE01_05510 [Phycisphaerales bacterium]